MLYCSAPCTRTSRWYGTFGLSVLHRDARLETHVSSFNVDGCARGHKPQHMPCKLGYLLQVDSGCRYPVWISIAIGHQDEESVPCSCNTALVQRSDHTKQEPWVRNFALPQYPSSAGLWFYSTYWCVLPYKAPARQKGLSQVYMSHGKLCPMSQGQRL